MRRIKMGSENTSLGEVIAASCELGSAVSPDRSVATRLAARHVGRVLAEYGNTRLAASLALMASEFGPSAESLAP